MADLPDISYLTPEERRIIEDVIMRQKQEEERQNEIMRLVSFLFPFFGFKQFLFQFSIFISIYI